MSYRLTVRDVINQVKSYEETLEKLKDSLAKKIYKNVIKIAHPQTRDE